MASKGMTSEDALKEVRSKTYDELDKITHVNNKIMLVLQEVEKNLFTDFTADSMEEIIRGDVDEIGSGYLDRVGDEIYKRNNKPFMIQEKVLDISKKLHDLWVIENPSRFNNEEDDKTLIHYLPQDFAGFDEISNQFIYMGPLFDKFGLPIGKMEEKPYGKFIGSDVYRGLSGLHIYRMFRDHYFKNISEFKDYIKEIINNYDALKPENAPKEKQDIAKARLIYMNDDKIIDKIIEQLFSSRIGVFQSYILSK